jgi:hypothetical protein
VPHDAPRLPGNRHGGFLDLADMIVGLAGLSPQSRQEHE